MYSEFMARVSFKIAKAFNAGQVREKVSVRLRLGLGFVLASGLQRKFKCGPDQGESLLAVCALFSIEAFRLA